MPSRDDGNCDELKRENGYCYKQCYMKCSNFDSSSDPSGGKCNYDSDCRGDCPAPRMEVSCDGQYSETPSDPGSASVERFISNMYRLGNRLN